MKLQPKGNATFSSWSHRCRVCNCHDCICNCSSSTRICCTKHGIYYITESKDNNTFRFGTIKNVMKIAGTVTAVGCINGTDCNSVQKINSTTIPLKISQPWKYSQFFTKYDCDYYIGKNIQYNDIYAGPITSDTFRQPVLLLDKQI